MQTARDLAALAVSGQVEVEIPFMCEKHTFFVMYMAILSFILHPYSLTYHCISLILISHLLANMPL